MKNEATNPGGRLAIAHRQPSANLLPDDYVRGALNHAGYGALPLGDRPSLYEALILVGKDDPETFENLVDHLREVLSLADARDRHFEMRRLTAKFGLIKACPDCRHKPDVDGNSTSDGQRAVICFNHEGHAVARCGPSIDEAIESWNRDDWIDPGEPRPLFAFD